MTISPFTPLFFLEGHKTDGLACAYVQTFYHTDSILLQILSDRTENVRAYLFDDTADTMTEITLKTWLVNDEGLTVRFAEFSLGTGRYHVKIVSGGTQVFLSEPFCVTDDERILDNTTLIQYSMKNNRQRKDTLFFINGLQYFFSWRVPGGFKDSGWTFGVENEQFVTQYSDIAQLWGLESTQKVFTMGAGFGVPVWFGEMLNRVLVCSHVYFDGVKYTRKETNVPEMNVQLEGTNGFVFSQTLQRSVNLDPVIEGRNHLILRRVRDGVYRLAKENVLRKV